MRQRKQFKPGDIVEWHNKYLPDPRVVRIVEKIKHGYLIECFQDTSALFDVPTRELFHRTENRNSQPDTAERGEG